MRWPVRWRWKASGLIEEENYLQKIARIEAIIRREFDTLNFPGIVHKRIIGAIGALEFKEASMLAGFNAFARTHGVWLRPIGNILYLMPPYIIEGAGNCFCY